MMTAPVTGEMATCLTFARAHGGRLVRSPGGFWSYPGAPTAGDGVPRPSFGTSTIEALVRRKLMIYTEHRQGKRGPFPIAAEVVPQADDDLVARAAA